MSAQERQRDACLWSLLADHFPEDKRALPVSIFLMGPYLGAGLSHFGRRGRWLGERLGVYRTASGWCGGALAITFMLVALPGLIMVFLLPLLREPPRTESYKTTTWLSWQRYPVTFGHVAGCLALFIGCAVYRSGAYALQAWVPSLLIRAHGLEIVEAGRYYGTIALVAGSAGVLSGPMAARWLASRIDPATAPLVTSIYSTCLLIPVLVGAGLAESLTWALVLITGASYLVTFPLALFATGLQNASPNEMRGLMAGCFVLSTNLIGLALGPTSVALASDYIFESTQAVGSSLALVGVVVLPMSLLFMWRGLAAIRQAS